MSCKLQRSQTHEVSWVFLSHLPLPALSVLVERKFSHKDISVLK